MAEIGRVFLGLDPLAPGRRGEGFRHSRLVAVDDQDVRAVATGHAAQHAGRQLVALPELVAADDDTHTGSIDAASRR
jgi:hypothetical protein